MGEQFRYHHGHLGSISEYRVHDKRQLSLPPSIVFYNAPIVLDNASIVLAVSHTRVYCPRRQPHSASLHPTIRALGVAASGGTRPWHQPRPIVRTGYVRIRLRDNKDFDERTAWVRNVADHARIVPYCSLKVIYRSLPLFVAPSKLSLLSLLSIAL